MSETIRLGLLGNNLGRSRAKNLHEMLGEMYGLNVTYEPIDLIGRPRPVAIEQELRRCRDRGFRGVNVTHPYKREAFACVSTMPGFPAGLTSVNTVLFNKDRLLADNTDYSGCCRSFKKIFAGANRPGRVLMLGAGGVGVAIAYALREASAEELIIYDLDEPLANDLVHQMHGPAMSARLAGPDLRAEMDGVDGLVNATPVGMFHYPGNPFPADAITNQAWAFDAVYTPEKTEFLTTCRRQGIRTLSGFYLFLYQGLDAFKHFAGIDADADLVEPAFLERFPLE